MQLTKRSLVAILGALFLWAGIQAQIPAKEKVVAGAERAFEKFAKTNPMPAPGCAVGVSLNGETVFEKAFGMAEMEHNITNTPQTIFESGSVAKQFTAAAVVLLQQDGKLSIDDPVRKYVPELPDYGKPLTIRHILTHTAGLRDWGSVMALTGSGRGDRVVTQEIALDVIWRQKGLDFDPGAEYSYSNSGYQLAALIVERVSKQKFGEFVGERLFKPLGMTKSSWRDDYRRVVPGRAQGYSKSGPAAPWMLNMPIMNVVGNGGLLTTVGDWLKWNAALDAKTLGEPFVSSMETQGILNDGRKITYALGLEVGDYKGIKEVAHSGGTAGYQTYLARFPEKKLSVAVMCNGFPPSSGDVVYGVVDEIFGPFAATAPPPAGVKMTDDEMKRYVGSWKNEKTRSLNPLTVANGELRLNGSPMRLMADGTFLFAGRKTKFTDGKDGKPAIMDIANPDGSVTRLALEQPWTPTPVDLASLAGDWYSEEAQAGVTFAVEGDKAFLKKRPTMNFPLQPLFKDHFGTPVGYIIWFTRDAAGKIDRMHVGAGRMRNMAFDRMRK